MQRKPDSNQGIHSCGWGRDEAQCDIHGKMCFKSFILFVLRTSPISGTDLISIVSPNMLKWDAVSQNKSLRTVQRALSRTAKQVIVQLIMSKDGYHLLVSLKDEMVSPKKTPKKEGSF